MYSLDFPVYFSLLLRSIELYYCVIKFTDFCPLSSSLYNWAFEMRIHCIFQFYDFQLVLFKIITILFWDFSSFLFFHRTFSYLLKYSMTVSKSFSNNSNIKFISVVVLVDCLFSFMLCLSWFVIWWVIFHYTLDILVIMIRYTWSCV